MKKIAGYISPLQNFLASPPQNEIRAARPVYEGIGTKYLWAFLRNIDCKS